MDDTATPEGYHKHWKVVLDFKYYTNLHYSFSAQHDECCKSICVFYSGHGSEDTNLFTIYMFTNSVYSLYTTFNTCVKIIELIVNQWYLAIEFIAGFVRNTIYDRIKRNTGILIMGFHAVQASD